MSATPEAVYGEPESEARAIIDVATRAVGSQRLDDEGRFHAFVTPAGGDVQVIDREQYLEHLRETPRRKTGVYHVIDVPSFVAYLAKHHEEKFTEVWANPAAFNIRAVLDAHGGVEGPRWEQHVVQYQAKYTDEWKAWIAHDGKLLSQVEFAEHLEDRLVDIAAPPAADMLELAQSFQATTDVRFESSRRLSSGERKIEYKETIDASAGRSGNLSIPEKFWLGIRPFEGAEGFRVECRFRYRIDAGTLRLGYKITRPNDVMREAFDSVVAALNDAVIEEGALDLATPILMGSGGSPH